MAVEAEVGEKSPAYKQFVPQIGIVFAINQLPRTLHVYVGRRGGDAQFFRLFPVLPPVCVCVEIERPKSITRFELFACCSLFAGRCRAYGKRFMHLLFGYGH